MVGCTLFTRNQAEPEIFVVQRTFFPMDTILTVVLHSHDTNMAENAIKEANKEIQRLENLLSSTIPLSEVSQIAQMAGIEPVTVSEETMELILLGIEYGHITNGKFDITIAPLLETYNWRQGAQTNNKSLPEPNKIEAAKSLVNFREIQIDQNNMTVFLPRTGMKIDLGGIAKGYIIDRAADLLKELGMEHGYVDGGGDIRFIRPKADGSPWRIGITNPRGPGIIAAVTGTDNAILSSGDYDRYFITDDGVRVHHIIDPHTGYPSSLAQSVTVVAENAVVADILSTAFFMLPIEEVMDIAKKQNVHVLIVTGEGQIVMSKDMEDITTLVE